MSNSTAGYVIRTMKLPALVILTVGLMGMGRECAAAKGKADITTNAGLFGDRALARGKGFEVMKSDVDMAVLEYKANLAAGGQRLPPGQTTQLRTMIRDRIVALKVVLGLASEADRAKGKETAEKFIKAARAESKTTREYERKLMTRGFTVDRWESQIVEKEISNVVLGRVLRAKFSVSDQEVKEYYDANPKEFEQPERVRAAHILLSTMDAATRKPLPKGEKVKKKRIIELLLERARKGEDFAKLAREFSEDPVSKDNGGEYTFPRGRMAKEFEEASFDQRVGTVSDVVESIYGYHIIKVYQKYPVSRLSLAEVSENLRGGLLQKKFQEALPGFLEKAKLAAGVEIVGD